MTCLTQSSDNKADNRRVRAALLIFEDIGLLYVIKILEKAMSLLDKCKQIFLMMHRHGKYVLKKETQSNVMLLIRMYS